MKPKHQRLLFVCFAIGFLILSVLFIMQAFKENLVYFYSPTDITTKPPASGQKIRVGGLVAEGSLEKSAGNHIEFIITDGHAQVKVHYMGMLPSLFREGQGVVAEGTLENGQFTATTILAKHDENYMPKEVVDALKASGRWQEGAGNVR